MWSGNRALCILEGINCPNVSFSLTFHHKKCAYNILGQSFVTRRVTLCRIKDTPFSKHHTTKKKGKRMCFEYKIKHDQILYHFQLRNELLSTENLSTTHLLYFANILVCSVSQHGRHSRIARNLLPSLYMKMKYFSLVK